MIIVAIQMIESSSGLLKAHTKQEFWTFLLSCFFKCMSLTRTHRSALQSRASTRSLMPAISKQPPVASLHRSGSRKTLTTTQAPPPVRGSPAHLEGRQLLR
jgi:hypothetical protein